MTGRRDDSERLKVQIAVDTDPSPTRRMTIHLRRVGEESHMSVGGAEDSDAAPGTSRHGILKSRYRNDSNAVGVTIKSIPYRPFPGKQSFPPLPAKSRLYTDGASRRAALKARLVDASLTALARGDWRRVRSITWLLAVLGLRHG